MSRALQSGLETEISDDAAMNVTPIVSVMMTTYNHEKYIADAIEGVISQKTDFPFELIIGEDCSADETRSIVLEYQRRYPGVIRVLFSERNMGAFNNSNRMFTKVRGELLAWCEADDYWNDPLKLAKQVAYLRKHLGCSLVHTDYHYLVKNFGKWRLIHSRYRPNKKINLQGKLFEPLLADMSIRTCTMMGRTGLVKQHFESAFRSHKYRVGDRPLVLHMSVLGDIGYIDEATATYRRTPGSMINSGYAGLVKMQRALEEIQNDFINAFGGQDINIECLKKRNYKTLASFAFRAAMRNDFNDALAWLHKNAPDIAGNTNVKVMKYLMMSPPLWGIATRVREIGRELDLYRRSLLSNKFACAKL